MKLVVYAGQMIGLNGTNGLYTGGAIGTNVDQSAIQWLKFHISPDATALSYADHGRVFDPAPTNAWWYYFPSLAVNCAGDMVMGFSGSSATNYIGAFYSYRLASDFMASQARGIRPGTVHFNADRWGDYSATMLDPSDDWSFWTVQEHAILLGPLNRWATVIARIKPFP